MSKWINSRDVLPPRGQPVLGFWFMGHEYAVVKYDSELGWYDNGMGQVYAPSHWMPLPQGPEMPR